MIWSLFVELEVASFWTNRLSKNLTLLFNISEWFSGPQDEVGCDVRPNTKLQNALCYALDGDHINVLNILSQKLEEPWVPFRNNRKPLLHLACEKGAWRCVQHLVVTRSDEINLIKDEYYPIHQVRHAISKGSSFFQIPKPHLFTVIGCVTRRTIPGTFNQSWCWDDS